MFLPRPASRRRLFQSTLPRGERPGCQIHGFYNILISIHAPARGATRSGSASGERLRNFNPRSREGSDDKEAKEFYNSAISIHAPARGATNPWKGVGELQNISIHAPARGATSSETRSPFRRQISIHAPARGATRCWLSVLHSHPISIHAPARGATERTSDRTQGDRNFNPRSREGSDDWLMYGDGDPYDISIHAPARGATMDNYTAAVRKIFQSTLPRGERQLHCMALKIIM